MGSLGSTTSDEAKIKIACIQMQPAIGKVEVNVAHSIGLINRAVTLGAKLVVLPELVQHRIHVPVARGSLRCCRSLFPTGEP